ncbi:hypothetical protein L1077_10000 [Pseudoalteromonas luteoviolacea]|uniref:hypothetical protein n=1 Tax=Pseudoalteromonas luteoviolacea TaxID=43657 RepID=UPI001F355957|nr:hypothetical protein [Pseudoalteromonas luteoviolacea]MCF6439763.1 hypothetical protein [Pseudoalteromonas luteoviolacea]
MDFHQVIAKDAYEQAYQSASAEFAVKAMILKHSPANIDNLTDYIEAGHKFISVCLSGHDPLHTAQLRMWFRRNLVLNSSRGSANLKFKHICRAELQRLDKHLKVVFSYYGSNIIPLLPQVK